MTRTQHPLAITEKLIALTGAAEGADPGSWTNVQIMPDGDVPIAGGEVLQLTPENAERVISAFNEQGVDVPVDIEHHTLDDKRADGAPAVGWIKSLHYAADRGLTAAVEWTDKGLGFVQSQEFKYLSPVLLFDGDGELYRLHSVALTNRPAIRFAESLKAASENLGDIQMPGKKKKKAATFQETLKALAEDVPTEETGDAIIDMGVVAGEIKALMGIEGDDMTLAGLLVAIRDKLKADGAGPESEGDDGDAEAGDDAMAASEAMRELGKMVKLQDAKPKAIVQAIREKIATSTSSTEVKALTDRINAMEKVKTDDRIDTALKAYHESGQINPNDGDAVANWRALAEDNFDRFMALASKLPVLVQQGEAFDMPDPTGTGRAKVLSDSMAKLKLERLTMRVETSDRAWANMALRDAELAPLTDDEATRFCRN